MLVEKNSHTAIATDCGYLLYCLHDDTEYTKVTVFYYTSKGEYEKSQTTLAGWMLYLYVMCVGWNSFWLQTSEPRCNC